MSKPSSAQKKSSFYRGIRAQLFFGFGALVLVINLFYSKLTFLFVDVTEGIVASFVIEQEIKRINPSKLESLEISTRNTADVSELKNQAFILMAADNMPDNLEFEQSMHDYKLFRFTSDTVNGFARQVHIGQSDSQQSNGPHNDSPWLMLNASKILPLSTFSSVFGVFLGSISIAVIILAILSTWFIASRLSAPLRNLTESVADQSVNAPCNMQERRRQDEIGQLALAFEDTYSELQHAWRREHDFASDVSHELRTPIALIRNTLAINQSSTLSSEERQLLAQSTDTLQNTVEVLLAIARKENLVFGSHSFVSILERTILALHHSHSDQDFNVDMQFDGNIRVIGNPNLMELLCQNLINNGFYHGGGSGMRIFQKRHTIVFENPILTEQTRQNYQGLGHGQYLVKRMIEVMDWKVAIEAQKNLYRVVVTPSMATI